MRAGCECTTVDVPGYNFPFLLFLGSRHDSDLSSSPPITGACSSLLVVSSSPKDQISYEVCFRLSVPIRVVFCFPFFEDEEDGRSRESPSRCFGLTYPRVTNNSSQHSKFEKIDPQHTFSGTRNTHSSTSSSFFTASQSKSPLSTFAFVEIAFAPGGGWNAQF